MAAGPPLVEVEPLMTRGLVTSSRYSPGNLTAEALERTFVGRDALLGEVLDRVRASVTTRGKHYTLLVGPRGAGKTHFMALLRNRLLSGERGGRMRLAALNEEEWGVASFLDFLVRILRALALTCPEHDIESGIEEVYRAFPTGERNAQDVARRLLKQVVGDGTLVVLCENLIDLFEGLGDEGQKRWRAAMQEDGCWTVVATTPALFSGVQLQTSPFYGFFAIRKLDGLEFETGVELLVRKARFEHKTDLANFLVSPVGRARVRAIHHVTGGNHRAYVIMSDFLTSQTLDQLVEPFMKMIDDLTPYYQDRMRQLSPFQRKLVEYLCTEAVPVPVKTIASRCLASPQSTAKQISELDGLGFVRRNRVGRETLCELAEPLMRICIEVKDNRTEHFKLFVQFLRRWFSGDELRSRLDVATASASDTPAPFQKRHLEAAIRDYAANATEPFLDALGEEVARCWAEKDYSGVIEAVGRLPPPRRSVRVLVHLVDALRLSDRLEEARAAVESGLATYPESVVLECAQTRVLVASGSAEDALVHVDSIIERVPAAPFLWWQRGLVLLELRRFDLLVENQRRLIEVDSVPSKARYILASALIQLKRFAEAAAESEVHVRQGLDLPESAVLLARALEGLHRHSEALRVLDEHWEAGRRLGEFLALRTDLLFLAQRYEQGLETAERWLLLEPENARAIERKVEALDRLDRLGEAEAFLMARPLEEWGTSALSSLVGGYKKRGDDTSLSRVANHVLAADATSASVIAKCELLTLLERLPEAQELASRWLEANPEDRAVRRARVSISLGQGECARVSEEMKQSLAKDPEDWEAWFDLGFARLGLGDRAGLDASFRRLLDAPASELASVCVAAEVLGKNRLHDSARRLTAHAMRLAPWDTGIALQHTQALVDAGDYAGATTALARAKELGAAVNDTRPLEAQLVCATHGLRAACSVVAEQAWSSHESVEEWAATMMIVEALEHGPRSLVAGVPVLRDLLARTAGTGGVAGALTTFVRSAVEQGLFAKEGWGGVAADLRPLFDGMVECDLPLKTLDVAIRYASGDEAALLELSLETRTLVTDAAAAARVLER